MLVYQSQQESNLGCYTNSFCQTLSLLNKRGPWITVSDFLTGTMHTKLFSWPQAMLVGKGAGLKSAKLTSIDSSQSVATEILLDVFQNVT